MISHLFVWQSLVKRVILNRSRVKTNKRWLVGLAVYFTVENIYFTEWWLKIPPLITNYTSEKKNVGCFWWSNPTTWFLCYFFLSPLIFVVYCNFWCHLSLSITKRVRKVFLRPLGTLLNELKAILWVLLHTISNIYV